VGERLIRNAFAGRRSGMPALLLPEHHLELGFDR